MLRLGLSLCVGLAIGCHAPDPKADLRALSPDACAGSVEEVDRLVSLGRLDEALREANNGAAACGNLPDLSERRAELGRQLGSNQDSWAEARALWTAAAAQAQRGEPVAAQRNEDRALHMAERLTGARARKTTLLQLGWAGWSDGSVWLSVTDRLHGAVARVELNGDAPTLVEIRDSHSWLPKLLWSARQRAMIVPGGASIGVYGQELDGWQLPGGIPHLSPDESTLVVSRVDGVSLYDLDRRAELANIPTTPDKTALLAPAGRVVAGGVAFTTFGPEGEVHAGERDVLVDLRRKELVFDQRVRASACSRSGNKLAAIVADTSNEEPIDRLFIWDAQQLGSQPLSVELEGSVSEVPSLVFDRQELQVQVAYAPAPSRALPVRATRRTAASYSLSSGERVPHDPTRFERNKSAISEALRALSGRGYEPLPPSEAGRGDSLRPVTASADGSTLVFVEAVRVGTARWMDPRAVFVDVASGEARARVDLKHGAVGLLRVDVSADGRWLFACLDANDHGIVVDATQPTTQAISGAACDSVQFSPDSRYLLAGTGLTRLESASAVTLDWEVCRIGPILAPVAVCRE